MPHAAIDRTSIPSQPSGLRSDTLETVTANAWKRLLGSTLRPSARWSSVDVAVSASVPLNGPSPAVGVLSVPEAVATEATVAILALQEDELASGDIEDALGELVVAIGAGLQTVLPGVTRVGSPSVVHGAGLSTVVPGAGLTCEARLRSAAGPVQLSLWHPRTTHIS